jgi:Fe/S biogenesis protein NfuA
MLTFTDRAREVVRSYLDKSAGEPQALRITLHDGSPLAPRYDLALVAPGDRHDDEVTLDTDDFTVLVREGSVDRLDGATVDFIERDGESGFQIRDVRPGPAPKAEGPIADRVRQVLADQVNPGIAAHGGAIELVAVEGTEVYIEMGGGCQGCALSRMTLRQGVERMLRDAVPEITELHDVTDHAVGANPYFPQKA